MATKLLTVTTILAAPALAHAQFAEPDVEVLYTLRGEVAGDSFGWAAEVIGDIDRDRADDYVITAPFNDAGGTNAGRAYVYSGRTGQLLHQITGDAANQRLGFSVAGPGDLDRDGTPDYVVGGVGGRAVALSGRDHRVLWDIRVSAEAFGFDLNAAGDVNRDGRPDVIVGAFAAADGANAVAGKVYVLSGRDGSTLWTQPGPNAGAGLGQGVSGIDDVDRDGRPDQVAAAPGAGPSNLGAAYVYSGRDGHLVRTLEPDPTAIAFGQFFTHDAGDVDRDGTRDILISDFADNESAAGAGKSYIFSGRTGDRLWVFLGEAAGDGFGCGRGVGDVDRDHHADLLLASFNSSAGAPSGGKVYLYSGKDGHVIRTLTGTVAGAQLGFDAIAIGDVDRDHRTDFLITGVEVAHVVAGARHGHGHGQGQGEQCSRAEDPPRARDAARDLAPALGVVAADRAHHERAAVDGDPGHLDIPVPVAAHERAAEPIGARADMRHARGDLVAHAGISRRRERQAILICDDHRVHPAILAAREQLVGQGLGDEVGATAAAFGGAHPQILVGCDAEGKKST